MTRIQMIRIAALFTLIAIPALFLFREKDASADAEIDSEAGIESADIRDEDGDAGRMETNPVDEPDSDEENDLGGKVGAALEIGILEETSPGGIEYALIRMPDHEDVSIQIAWPSDWSYREGINKAAPAVGVRLIFAGGAQDYPAGDAEEQFAELNTEGDIHVAANDHVVLELTFERDRLAETIAIANAHLRVPALDREPFEAIRDALARKLEVGRSRPLHAGFEALRWSIFGEQPLRAAISFDAPGTFEELTREDIAVWHAETFARNPDAIAVAGGVGPDVAGPAIDALFEGLPGEGSAVSAPEAKADYAPRRILLHMPNSDVSSISFVARLPPTRLGGEIEDLILTRALGEDGRGELSDAVRERIPGSRGLVVGTANFSREHRILYMAGEADADSIAEIERVVRQAYSKFYRSGPDAGLAELKAPLEAIFSELAVFAVDQARSELQSVLDGFGTGKSLQLSAELAGVTEASLAERLGDAFPAPEEFIVVAVSSDTDALPQACVISTPQEALGCP